jgi:sulfate permease, SulP family
MTHKGESMWDLEKRIPLIKSLRIYDVETLIADIMAGITVTFTLIPQGIAYAALVGTPAIFGLYTGSLPLYIYAVTGTSRHIVHGPFAVTCFMLGEIGARYSDVFVKGTPEYTEFVLYVSLISGIFFWLALYLKLGSLMTMITPSVTSGFITGCGLLVFLHQLPLACGFTLGTHQYTTEVIAAFFKKLGDSSSIALWISMPTWIFLLVISRYKRSRNDRLSDDEKNTRNNKIFTFILNMPIMFVFVLGYFVSKTVKLSYPDSRAAHELIIVGDVPSGFQAPLFNTSNLSAGVMLSAIPAAMTLTIVSAMASWSISKRFAEKYKYDVEINQELFSYGLVNVIGSTVLNSFFNAGGLARTAVSVESGARTQISNMVAATFITISVLFFANELYYIPRPTLGAITMAAISGLIDFPLLITTYKKDKKDAAVMLSTTICTVFLGVAQGILLGVCFSLLGEVYGNFYPRILRLGLSDSGKYDDGEDSFSQSNTSLVNENMLFVMGGRIIPRICITRIDTTSLFFGNIDYSRIALLDIYRETCRYTNYAADLSSEYNNDSSSIYDMKEINVTFDDMKVIIIDISAVRSIDNTASICLNELRKDLLKENCLIAYVQGSGLDDELHVHEDDKVTDNDTESQTSDVNKHTEKSIGLRNRRGLSNSAYTAAILKSGLVTSDRSQYSISSQISAQLNKAGAVRNTSKKNPIMTIFKSVKEAVKYFTVQMYTDCISKNNNNVGEGSAFVDMSKNPMHSEVKL